jgi:hypothetical protein
MAQEPASRPELIGEMLRQQYPSVVALDANATQGQLEEAFKDAGISGSTIRKAINFYLQAAEFAEIPVSRHFKTPRATSGNGRRATNRGKKTPEIQQTPPPPPPAPHSDLHPIVQGLLKELPPAGGTWTSAKREQWLGIVQATVDMLITVEDDGGRSASSQPAPRADEE